MQHLRPEFALIVLLALILPASSSFAQQAYPPEEPFSPARPMVSAPLDSHQTISRIIIGSCASPVQNDDIYNVIRDSNGDVMLLIGDNVYAADETNDPDLKSLREAYGQLAESRNFSALRASLPLLVTWDDHDFGLDDAGGDWPYKKRSQDLFKHVWAVHTDDPRSTRDGVYYARISGPPGRRVQFILLDTRYFRSALYKPTPKPVSPDPSGLYLPSTNEDQQMLGEEQWQWLETQLTKQAEIRIIATSIQMIAEGHYREAWRTLPKEQDRFFRLLDKTKANGVVLVSGDKHSAAIYRLEKDVPYPLWEMTASSLNLPLSNWVSNIIVEPGPNRIGEPYYDANFGVIEIDWQTRRILLQIMDDKGRVVLANNIKLDSLKVP